MTLPGFFDHYVTSLQSAPFRQRLAFAVLFGAIMALALPPFNLAPLLWVCFPTLAFLLQGAKNNKQAFATGWCFAFGHMVVGLYWIAASMFVDLKHFWWAIPLACAGLPACFAFYYGFAVIGARYFGTKGLPGALALGLGWYLADYARGHLFTGFPWNLVAYTWSFDAALPLLQITSIIGIYGLNLLTIVAAFLPAALFEKSKRAKFALIASFAILIAFSVWGEMRLKVQVADVPNVRLRLVQPNTNQITKWEPSQREANLRQLLDESRFTSEKPITHIIWPETASAYYLAEDSVARKEIADWMPEGSEIITGVIRRDTGPEGRTRFYNSLIAIDKSGRVVAGYDKFHLVPFGEYMPFRKYLPKSIQAVAASDADFTPGSGVRSLRVKGLPAFSPLICYEAIFPGNVADEQDRPQLLINVTNDAWYGHTTGPFQHFAIARVRAIEEGIPLARADNVGISAVIDPLGRTKAMIGFGKEGYVDSDLPEALPLTLYGRFGDIQAWVVFVILSICLIVIRTKKVLCRN